MRVLAAAALLGALSGCLSAPPLPPEARDKPELRPELFFAGRTHGTGELEVRGRDARAFTVESSGRAQSDGSFQVDQTITYADGPVEIRTWTVRRTAGNTYQGTISGAAGEVTAETRGSVLHLRYLVRKPAVYMEQRLYLQPDGRSVINFATITVAGVPWARLAEQITRDAE